MAASAVVMRRYLVTIGTQVDGEGAVDIPGTEGGELGIILSSTVSGLVLSFEERQFGLAWL